MSVADISTTTAMVENASIAKTTKTNGDIAYALLKLSNDYDDDDYCRIMAYRNGAEAISNLDFQVTQGSELAKGPKKVAGIGKGIARLIDEFLNTGTMTKTVDLRADMNQTGSTPITTPSFTTSSHFVDGSSKSSEPVVVVAGLSDTDIQDECAKCAECVKCAEYVEYVECAECAEYADYAEEEVSNLCSREVFSQARAKGVSVYHIKLFHRDRA